MPTAASLVLREICGNCTGAPERRKLSRSGHSFEPLSVMPAESAAAPILLHCENCDPACVFSERGANKWNRVARIRSEEHTSELQSLMRISYAVFCLKKKKKTKTKKCKTENQEPTQIYIITVN